MAKNAAYLSRSRGRAGASERINCSLGRGRAGCCFRPALRPFCRTLRLCAERGVRRPTFAAQGLAPELSMTAPNVRCPRPRVNLNTGHPSAQTSAEAGTRRREDVQEPPGISPSPPAQNHTPYANDAEDARRAAVSQQGRRRVRAGGGAGVRSRRVADPAARLVARQSSSKQSKVPKDNKQQQN